MEKGEWIGTSLPCFLKLSLALCQLPVSSPSNKSLATIDGVFSPVCERAIASQWRFFSQRPDYSIWMMSLFDYIQHVMTYPGYQRFFRRAAKRWEEKRERRWENLWLPVTVDWSYHGNRFELGSRSDTASWLEEPYSILWLARVNWQVCC